jgi:WD40 repeat protein
LFGASLGGTAIDVASGKSGGRLEAGAGVRWVSFSPDGKSFVAGHYNTGQREAAVVLRTTDTGKQLARWPCGADQPRSGSWSRDGSRFAAVTRHRVWTWDVKTGKLLGPDVPAHEGIITGMTFASDGRLFTTSDDHTIRAWDSTTGKEVLKLSMDGWARGMDVTLSGALVAGNALQNDFRIWDARSGEQIFKLLGHGRMGGLRRVRFSQDEQTLLSFADDGYLRKWDTLTGKLKAEHRFRPRSQASELTGEDEENDGFAFISRALDLGQDGNTFVMADGKHVSVFAADTGKERFKIEVDPWTVNKLILSPDGKRLATAGPGVAPPKPGQPQARPKDCQITVWDLSTAKPIVQFRSPGSTVGGALAFTSDGKKVVTASSLPTMYFWDAATGESAGAMSLQERPFAVAFTPDGKRAAVAFGDTSVLVYDLAVSIKAMKKE